jgi:hypothetical protein
VTQLAKVIELGSKMFGAPPFAPIRLPDPTVSRTAREQRVLYARVWTTDHLRPRWDNLGLLLHEAPDDADVQAWTQRLATWPARGSIVALKGQVLLFQKTLQGALTHHPLEDASLEEELSKWKSLFTPRALAKFRPGQLQLYDSFAKISPDTLEFLQREHARLEKALEQALSQAVAAERAWGHRLDSQRVRDVLSTAVAYLAARVLEDKGFFGPDAQATDDPLRLLRRTAELTNGFFKNALIAAPTLSEHTLQALAANLGSRVNFDLVDHNDVGQLYEHLLGVLAQAGLIGSVRDLQSHYTPLKLAERMLERLPIEELAPEDRVVFDPASGSGSLLLAATSRLLNTSDAPENREAIKPSVFGSDIDPHFDLIIQLRYTLAQEAIGDKRLFPRPKLFLQDYRTIDKNTLSFAPRILVANPPFAEHGSTQLAVDFVLRALQWMSDGALFAFILPQSFLAGKTHGFPAAREALVTKSRLFEVWQAPEGVAGLAARQPICVVFGRRGKPSSKRAIVHAVLSGAEAQSVRKEGFSGPAWLTTLGDDSPSDWSGASFPTVEIDAPTVRLGNLYGVFSGITENKEYKPVDRKRAGPAKPYWKAAWLLRNSLWANPSRVHPEQRWIRYDKEHLLRMLPDFSTLFSKPKVLLVRVTNRNTWQALRPHLDTTGLCPNNNVFCIVPIEEMPPGTADARAGKRPRGWDELPRNEKLAWLVGVLASDVAAALSLKGRPTRHLQKSTLLDLPLPAKLDKDIITTVFDIIEEEKTAGAVKPSGRANLNRLVRKSYGDPLVPEIYATGVSPFLADWKSECQRPSMTVIGQVIGVDDRTAQHLKLYVNGIDDTSSELSLRLPQDLPGWALDGAPFQAQAAADVKDAKDLNSRPWTLRQVRPLGRPYMKPEELEEELRSLNLL